MTAASEAVASTTAIRLSSTKLPATSTPSPRVANAVGIAMTTGPVGRSREREWRGCQAAQANSSAAPHHSASTGPPEAQVPCATLTR